MMVDSPMNCWHPHVGVASPSILLATTMHGISGLNSRSSVYQVLRFLHDFPLHIKHLNQQRKEVSPGMDVSAHPPADTHTSRQTRAWELRPQTILNVRFRPQELPTLSENPPEPSACHLIYLFQPKSVILLIVPLISL